MGFQIGIAERHRRPRRVVSTPWIGVLGALTVLALGFLFWIGVYNSPRDDSLEAVARQGQAIRTKFDLVDHTGKRVTENDFRGRYLLVYFGFTSCPDVCPTTLATITDVLNRLGEHGEQIEPLFITIDPERDTPMVMAEYLKRYHPRIRGLTGSAEQVREAQEAFRVQSTSVQGRIGMAHRIDHMPLVYFMGPDGAYLTNVSRQMPPVKVIERIRPFM